MLTNIRARIARWLGLHHIQPGLRIRFYTEANAIGEHGKIVVTHVKQGLVETPVPFVFEGVTKPPVMSLETLVHIWHEAQKQGYIPFHVTEYGKKSEIISFEK